MYKVYSELYQCEYIGVEHEKDYTISVNKILSQINDNTDLVILNLIQIVQWVNINNLKK